MLFVLCPHLLQILYCQSYHYDYLYASWRRILDGADGINVEYTATGKDGEGNTVVGSDAPNDTNKYSDQAQAIARPAAKAPEAPR